MADLQDNQRCPSAGKNQLSTINPLGFDPHPAELPEWKDRRHADELTLIRDLWPAFRKAIEKDASPAPWHSFLPEGFARNVVKQGDEIDIGHICHMIGLDQGNYIAKKIEQHTFSAAASERIPDLNVSLGKYAGPPMAQGQQPWTAQTVLASGFKNACNTSWSHILVALQRVQRDRDLYAEWTTNPLFKKELLQACRTTTTRLAMLNLKGFGKYLGTVIKRSDTSQGTPITYDGFDFEDFTFERTAGRLHLSLTDSVSKALEKKIVQAGLCPAMRDSNTLGGMFEWIEGLAETFVFCRKLKFKTN